MIGRGARPDLSGYPRVNGAKKEADEKAQSERIKRTAKAILDSVGLTKERVLAVRRKVEGHVGG